MRKTVTLKVMSSRFVTVDRETPMLFPPDLKDWVKKDSLAHYIIDAVDTINIHSFSINQRGSGDAQYSPQMMLCLLIYCYATGRFSSRMIEEATYNDVAARYICGGDHHPDHDTICTFRRKNGAAIKEAFVKVLMLAKETGIIKKVGGISIDGTKIKANASKHSAASYKRAGQTIRRLEREIEELMKKAEQVDSTPLEDGLTIPEELSRREERKKKLKEARRIIEERYKQEKRDRKAEYEKQTAHREEMKKAGKKVGRKPERPQDEEAVPDKMQVNFTDEESRIMKCGGGNYYEQCYNAQAAVDTEGSMLILGSYITNHANDKKELNPAIASVDAEIREIESVCADTGYYSEYAASTAENNGKGPRIYCAVERTKHHYGIEDIEKKDEKELDEENYTTKEIMKRRLKSKEGRKKYKKRKETVEPVFGIIKEVMGFRSFHLRGLEKVKLEWQLVSLAYNFKRIHRIAMPQAV